ncbi:MAG: hypothetical protein HON78_05220 [Legionellales bacterium]|jgi:hypothetical protein|nr:hypothetical protein [Legionellales bacterium]
MNKQLMKQTAQLITALSISIIIASFNPSFLMLVWIQLSAFTALALVNNEQHSWMLGSAAILIIVCPDVLTLLPISFFVLNTVMLAASMEAASSIASFLYDMIPCNTQINIDISRTDNWIFIQQTRPDVSKIKNENIKGTLEKEHNYCLCCTEDKEKIVIPGTSIKQQKDKTTLFNEKIGIFDRHGICSACFEAYENKTENPTSRAKETKWHIFDKGIYETSIQLKDNKDKSIPKNIASTPYYSFMSSREFGMEYIQVTAINTILVGTP